MVHFGNDHVLIIRTKIFRYIRYRSTCQLVAVFVGNMAELLLNGKRLEELKVSELKDELDKRDLSKKGNKSSLLERLRKVPLFAVAWFFMCCFHYRRSQKKQWLDQLLRWLMTLQSLIHQRLRCVVHFHTIHCNDLICFHTQKYLYFLCLLHGDARFISVSCNCIPNPSRLMVTKRCVNRVRLK